MATGEWSSDNLSTLAEKLKDENKKVNLDLSGVEGLETIGVAAFNCCSSLTSINIPASVKTIGDGAFVSGSSLNISVNENNTTYSSEDGMLLNKEKTILIAYPSAKGTVTNVPASVTSIGDYAFSNCSSLKSISLPSSVTSIGKRAFVDCSNLATVTMEATEPPTLYDAVFNKTSADLQILVPNDSEEAYKNATTDKGWDSYKDKIKAKE